MVADSAIGEQQINYSSFVTGFNKTTNTSYINASKVAINLTGQTLDVAFNNINTKVDGVKTTTDTNTTSITAIQGQISTLISNTTITATDGTTTQLKDAYNGTVNTINSMKTSIGELTTDIDANTKDITSVTSRTSTLETNLSSISATLSSTKSTVDTHTTQISTANTNITTALNNASSAVSTANTANTTANSAKTTATTASTNASNAVTTANTASTNASNAVSTANKASTDVATLTTTVTNTVSRVSSLELTASGLTTRVGNTETAISTMQIGGRNLWLRTKEYDVVNDTRWVDNNGGSRISSYTVSTSINGFGVIRIATWWTDLSQRVTLEANTNYVLSAWIKSESDTALASINAYVNSGSTVISQNFTQNQAISTTWTRYCFVFNSGTLTTSTCRFESSNNNAYLIYGLKLEKGNKPTDWTPAPEDVDNSIASVKDYATQTINSNVSTINQTTDSIKASVQSLQSSVSTINTTLGNKADSSTVTSVTNRVSTLETGVNGINASITTLNSNVSSVTTTANAAKSAIDNLSIGGRNLIRNSIVDTDTSYWSMSFGVRDTNIKFNNHNSVKIRTTGSGYDGIKSNGYTIPFKANTTYTFTIWAYRDSSSSDGNLTKILRVYMPEYKSSTLVDYRNYINITSSNLPDKTWTKFTGSFTTKNDSTSFSALQIDYNNVAGTSCVWISDIKVEEGTESTSWTPAPEDIDSQITTVNSSVSSLQSSVSVLQNQIALKVEQSNIDSAVSTLNGKITAQNTTISSLQSQINVQAGQISSKVSQTDISNANLCVKSQFNTTFLNTNMTNGVSGYGFKFPSGTNIPTGWIYNLNLKLNTNYTISFVGWCTSGTVTIYNDLWPDSLPEKGFNLTTTPTKFTWTLNSSDSNMKACSMRFFYYSYSGGNQNISTDAYITDIKLEEGSISTSWNNSIGTIITQSTTEVMTAFNNISSYFKVNKDGATFGDTSTGDYTVLGANGMKHHVGGTDYDYMYITYVMDATINIIEETYTFSGQYATKYDNSDAHKHDYFIPYDSTLKTLLNGRTPKLIMTISSKSLSDPTRPSGWTGTGISYTYGSLFSFDTTFSFGTDTKQICDANGITMRGINGIYQEIDTYDAYDFIKNKTFNIKTGGTVGVRFLIFA